MISVLVIPAIFVGGLAAFTAAKLATMPKSSIPEITNRLRYVLELYRMTGIAIASTIFVTVFFVLPSTIDAFDSIIAQLEQHKFVTLFFLSQIGILFCISGVGIAERAFISRAKSTIGATGAKQLVAHRW